MRADCVQIHEVDGRLMISLVDRSQVELLARRVLLLLMSRPDARLTAAELQAQYLATFQQVLALDDLQTLQSHGDYIKVRMNLCESVSCRGRL